MRARGPIVALGLLLAACGGSVDQVPVTVTVSETETVTVTVQAAPEPAPAETGAVVDAGDLVVQYVPAADPTLQAYIEFVRQAGIFDTIAANVNAAVALPRDVIVSIEESGNPSPYYQPTPAAIIVPPEFLAFADTLFTQTGLVSTQEDAQELLLAATAFVFYHEMGHMLVDQLDIPATGREEDAVDQLATLIAAQEGEVGAEVAAGGALFFAALAANRAAFEAADFWDEHSLDEQRFFNIVCWFYGSDPQAYADLPLQAGLGEDRLTRCTEEYQQIADSWQTLLAPHFL